MPGKDFFQGKVPKTGEDFPNWPCGTLLVLGSITINQPESSFDNYTGLIIGSLIVLMILAVVIIFLNLSLIQHRQAEQTLRESEERLRLALEGTRDGIWDWNLETGQVYFSLHSYTSLGYEAGEFPRTNKGWQQLIHPDDMEAVEKTLQQALAELTPFAIEFRLRAKNGDWRWLLSRGKVVELDKNGKAVRMAGFHTDITEHKGVEEALRASEARLRAIMDGAPFGAHSYELQPDGRMIFSGANQSADRILTIDHSLLVGKTIEEAFPGLVNTPIPETYRRVATSGESFDTDQVNYEEGRIRGAFEVHAFQTGPNRMTVFFHDITERKRAEVALQESEQKFRTVVQNAQAIIFILDREGRFLLSEGQALAKLGLAPGQVVGLSALELYKDNPSIIKGIKDALAGIPVHITNMVQDAIFDTVYSPYYNLEGTLTGVIGIAIDITERKQAEETLELFRYSIDQASIAIFWMNREAGFSYVNDQACRSLGYSREELLSLRLWDIDSLYPKERWFSNWEQYQENRQGGGEHVETCHRRKDGVVFPVEVSSKHLWLGDHELHVAFVRDISERRQAEEDQAKLEEQLRQAQKMESIGRLAGGLAHDFNNLLTVIQGYCGLMQAQISNESPLLEDLKQIQRAGERATTLVRQLLAFSRKQVLAPTLLDLNSLVANLRKMLERLIGEDITLSTVLQPGLWTTIADPSQIEQVIMNLVVNARDAMPTGGKLTIETRNVLLDHNYLKSRLEAPSGPCVMLVVTDTGCGMDADTQARIFEPFFTTKEAGKGTGLGLATVYGIIKQSGGDIMVYSEPDQGTTFTIYLPTSEPGTKVLAAAQADSVVRGGTETILLVEDEERVRQLAQTVLQSKGYMVLEAGHGSEALFLFEQHQGPIDLLLTDVVMPQMSGRELAEQLKARQPQLKVLFMSGYTDDAVVRHGLLAAKVEYLAKPFALDTLVAKVREVLDK